MSSRLLWPLSGVYDWLACADPLGDAGLIFVLAGRQDRKIFALRLFDEGRAPRILLSTARYEVRRFAQLALPVPLDLLGIASAIPPPQRHFFVYFERQTCQVERIPLGRLGTLSEIQALANWLRPRPQIASISIVTSGAHLRRVRMCCRALLPKRLQLQMIAVPEQAPAPHAAGRRWAGNAGILSEVAKLLIYRIGLTLRGSQGGTA